jgi:hypothetical protein
VESLQVCPVAWLPGECPYKADDLLKPAEDEESKSTAVEAAAFLQALLADGPLASVFIFEQGKENGFGEATLKRGKAKAKIKAQAIKGPDG